MNNSTKPSHYHKYYRKELQSFSGEVIVEKPISLSVNGHYWITFMCTPIDLNTLGVGFLFNENQIQSIEEVEINQLCDSGNSIDIWLTHPIKIPNKWRKTSGCSGGTTSVNTMYNEHPEGYVRSQIISVKQLFHVYELLLEAQFLYRETGGVHTSILSDGKDIIVSSEDIGRHNTLDKIAGYFLINKTKLDISIIATTGRISSEMLQKAARMNADVVISRTSPTSLSIELADKIGITLIGYIRRDQFKVYTHPERISI